MKNVIIIFILFAVACFTLAVELRDMWWAFPGCGAVLFLFVLSRHGSVHTLSHRSIFFALAPLVAVPLLLQAGAGVFAFAVAGVLVFIGAQLRKRDAAVVAALMTAAQRAKAHLEGVQE